MSIPTIVFVSGVSLLSAIQLIIAPERGMENRHIFNSDTFTPGCDIREYHIAKVAAGMIPNHIMFRSNGISNSFNGGSSTMSDIIKIITPPIRLPIAANT